MMGTLLPKLGDLLKEEYELQKGVRGEIKFLEAELESMQAALLKVSEAPIDQPPDIQVKLWARDVKELSYDVEDTIDAFMVRVDTRAPKTLHGLMGFINRSINLLTKAHVRHKIGTDIKDIKRRTKEVSERRYRYKVDNVVVKPVGPTIDSLRLSALYKKATELVGTEEKSDGLIKRLMEGDEASKQQLKIVSIVGFGGLGKTTLANVVYQKLKVQFDCGAFISVSLNPNMEKISKNMLHQLGKHSNIDDEAQLINELREFLQNRRYLVVIDDIWNNSVWGQIKDALIENKCGSRIITTTRILDVAKHVGGVYQLEPLSPVDSRKLFYQRIFGVEDYPHDQLVEVSERILKKCGGVPLAIITIASLLASKKGKENTQKHWYKVCQSIGSGLDDSFDLNNMRRILSISYYDLPPHLKTCLLHLSLYPEDYEINAEALIWKWIGEGFVHNEQGKGLREVGEDYLDELINKSLIQPVDITEDNKVETCRVHDMVLDLITSLSNEEHFLTTLGGQQPVTVPTKIRRLSLQTSNEDDVKQLSTMSLSYVRSLTLFQEAFSLLPALSSFPVLRALDLGGCRYVENRHCKDICNLFHLRYLNLCRNSISEIPKEIGNLQSLQVLDVRENEIEELPSTLVQLRQLVRLRVDRSTRPPDGFGNLICLQELLEINITSPAMLHDLGELTKLRHLDIEFDAWDERYEEAFLQCLSNLVSLESLQIFLRVCGDLGSRCEKLSPGPELLRSIGISGRAIHTVPRWMSSLSSLSYLAIRLETLGVEDLQVLGGMPALGDLDLTVQQGVSKKTHILECHHGGGVCAGSHAKAPKP